MPWYEHTNGDRLWYEDQGTGPAIVLLHGWCMSSAVWRLQLESLSGRFRVIAPDLAGHGRSAQSAEGYGFACFANDLAALFRHLGLADVILAGWSLGGQIALQAFGLLRDRLAGLALISTTPHFAATDDFPWGLTTIEVDGMALKLRRSTRRALQGFTARMFAPGELDDAVRGALIRDLLAAVPIPETAVALESLESLAKADMRHLLPAIDCPAVIINGNRDVICLPDASAFLERQIPGSRRVVMQGCGHAPFLTRSQEFDACLADFSRRVCGSTIR